jgi:hypothetical protein
VNEKTKLLWMLEAVLYTLTTRLRASSELTAAVQRVIELAIFELDPNGEVRPPNIQYQVNDFKLPKDLLERGRTAA